MIAYRKMLNAIVIVFAILTGSEVLSADQCNTTQQCKAAFGLQATDCKNSRSSSSICMCGAIRCDSVMAPTPTPLPTSVPTPPPNPIPGTDQCDTTSQCKAIFGDKATDCKDSRSNSSICMCGSSACTVVAPTPVPTAYPTPIPSPKPTKPPGASDMLGLFDIANDVFLANFDTLSDPDDIQSMAATATMLSDSRFQGINYYAITGAYNPSRHRNEFVDASSVMNLSFGNRWSSAHANYNRALDSAFNAVSEALYSGGDLWIMEAGMSDFSADLVRRIKRDIPSVNTQQRVHIYQHSEWNMDVTSQEDLSYVKQNTNFVKIDNGNKSGNGTAALRTGQNLNSLWGQMKSHAATGAAWSEAERMSYQGYLNWKGHEGQAGSIDFSDVVEALEIFGFGRKVKDVPGFIKEFM